IHPEYTRSVSDIALIELDEPIHFDVTASPVCIPSANTTVPGYAKGIATGFGSAGDFNPAQLQETMTPLVPEDVCRENWFRGHNTICGGSQAHLIGRVGI
ncbi:hypothetical protein PMAYCL1PPCAC_32366, partial [Pristionchus mayeri]